MNIQWTKETAMPNQESLILKLSTFLITENKLNHIYHHISGYPHSFHSLRKALPHRKMPANKPRKSHKLKVLIQEKIIVKIFKWMIGEIKYPFNAKAKAHRLLSNCKEKR